MLFTWHFSPELLHRVAEVIATEARAIYNNASNHGNYNNQKSVSCLAPFINIMRHPLWGRVQVVLDIHCYSLWALNNTRLFNFIHINRVKRSLYLMIMYICHCMVVFNYRRYMVKIHIWVAYWLLVMFMGSREMIVGMWEPMQGVRLLMSILVLRIYQSLDSASMQK